MNFLALVNKVRQEADASGPELTTLAGTLPLGDRRLKSQVQEAWREIQGLHGGRWEFMRLSFSSPLTGAVREYAASALMPSITSFRDWKVDSLRVHTTGDFGDEQMLPYMAWPLFRDQYLFGSYRSQTTRPTIFSVDPQKRLVFGPIPTAGWTVNGEYWRAPQELTADTDVPIMPDYFHDLIVYRALMLDAEFEHSRDAMAKALRGAKRLTGELEADQLEDLGVFVTTA